VSRVSFSRALERRLGSSGDETSVRALHPDEVARLKKSYIYFSTTDSVAIKTEAHTSSALAQIFPKLLEVDVCNASALLDVVLGLAAGARSISSLRERRIFMEAH
jgi:hypothetical protein